MSAVSSTENTNHPARFVSSLSGLRRSLGGAALGALCVLIVLPSSRSLVLQQIALAVGSARYVAPIPADRALAVADRSPHDLLTQIGVSTFAEPDHTGATPYDYDPEAATAGVRAAAYLRSRQNNWPGNPAFDAALIAADAASRVGIHRAEDYVSLFNPKPGAYVSTPIPPPSSPQALAEWDSAAADGERAEPNNAFFPLARAVGFLAARRDMQAVAELDRTAGRSQWDDHLDVVSVGHRQLWETTTGAYEMSLGRAADKVYTDTARDRVDHEFHTLARIMASLAVNAELAGRFDEGLHIRRSMLRCGASMSAQSTSYIGSFIGDVISNDAILRPGGAPGIYLPEPKPDVNVDWKARAARQLSLRRDAYRTYLLAHGQADEATWTDSVFRAEDTGCRILKSGRDLDTSISPPLLHLLMLWLVGTGLLGGALWVVGLGAMGTIAAAFPLLRRGAKLPIATRLCLFAGSAAACPLMICLSGWSLIDRGEFTLILAPVAFVWISVFFLLIVPRQTRRFAIPVALVSLLAFGIMLGMGLLAEAQLGIQRTLELHNFGLIDNVNSDDTLSRLVPPWLGPVSLLAAPFLLCLILTLAAIVQRRPVAASVARGLRGWAIPAASILILGYVVLALVTVRQEAAIEKSFDSRDRHAGRYVAGVTGQTWPDIPPAPPTR